MDSRSWDQRYAEGARNGTVWGAEPNRWLVAETREMSPGRALDLAAGEGRNALWLAQQGWQVVAVDFSAIALQTGQQIAEQMGPQVADHTTWVYADLLEYVPERSAFDLVLLSYLHLPAPARRTVLRQAAGALAPGGTLLVIGHDATNPTNGHGGPRDASVLFTADDVVAELTTDAEGLPALTVVRAGAVERPVETPEGPRTAIDALARLQRPVA